MNNEKKDYNDELPLGCNADGWRNTKSIVSNAERQKQRDELLLIHPMFDASSVDDVENEMLCQFCVHFCDKKNYLGQTVHFCKKSKDSMVNSGSKCFNNKFERA